MEFNKNTSNFRSYLSIDTSFTGKLKASGIICIDGEFKGEIESDYKLVIGPQGKVDANIKASNIVVEGDLAGDINVNDEITITSTGKVAGIIRNKQADLIIEKGGIFTGRSVDGENLPQETKLFALDLASAERLSDY
ncbi:MAG: polymer-forming cytoskeletal protein [Actinomycetota bacterium]|nr:polymer-forming cytoskeletal protein [Actinomycetota bacterium]